MGMTLDLGHKLQLAPAKAVGGSDVPRSFLYREFCLQDAYILCPADLHGLVQQDGAVLIGAVKFPHPARVAGREARNIRVVGLANTPRRSRRRFWGALTPGMVSAATGSRESIYLAVYFRKHALYLKGDKWGAACLICNLCSYIRWSAC